MSPGALPVPVPFRAWQRHRPEQTVLFPIVRDHLEGFLRHVDERYARPLPPYVRQAFASYLRCGILEHGFVRVHCDACRKDRLVAFSCKARGTCPSCGARAMCNTAAHLVDRVLPNVPIRQWVLSLPFDLRRLCARRGEVVSAIDRILFGEVERWMRRASGPSAGKAGAVTFVQRFGSTLNLHVHLHVLMLDGLFTKDGNAPPRFHPAAAPGRVDLADVVRRIRNRVMAWLRRRGWVAEDEEVTCPTEPDALDGCVTAALEKGRLADLAPPKTAERLADDDGPATSGGRSAVCDGFNLHAAVRVPADDDVSREKLARYCARPPFALERLSVLPDGRIAYRLKSPRRGATHRVLSPLDLLARIAALVSPPRQPATRYHGVLAPSSKWRSAIVPREAPPSLHRPPLHHTHDIELAARVASTSPGESSTPAPSAARSSARCAPRPREAESLAPEVLSSAHAGGPSAAETAPGFARIHPAHRTRLLDGRLLATGPRLDWAALLRRTYEVDILRCPRCEGPTRVLAAITDPAAIEAILRHVGEPPARAPPSRARDPDLDDGEVWTEPNDDPVA